MAGFFELRLKAGLSWVLAIAILFIFSQMIISLIVFGGVFINSDQEFISPFRFCLKSQDGGFSSHNEYKHCDGIASGSAAENDMSTSRAAIILCLYAPLVLVAFALLAMLLAAYSKDLWLLYFSVFCQAMSSILTLIGLTLFVVVYWSYVVPAVMTVWYYTCVVVHTELAITALLTGVLASRQKADWK